MFLILLLSLLFCPITAEANYYAKVDSLAEAQRLEQSTGHKLLSYNYKIAVYDDKKKASITATTQNIKLYKDNIAKTARTPYNDKQIDMFEDIKSLNPYLNGITGKGAVVAVVDSGCDVNHKDLKRNICGTYNIIYNNTDVSDPDGHGTHVAGIIAAQDDKKGAVGVAPDCKLYIIKACSNDNSGVFYYSDLIRALYKCIELKNINVINLSVAGTVPSVPMKEALEECYKNGILVCCAAGNGGSSTPTYPAAYQVGLSVTSGQKGELSYYSNYGINENCMCPGEDIYSTFPKNRYDYMSGTSMSSPIAAGVAALIYSKYKTHDASMVKSIILNNLTDGAIDVQKIFGYKKVTNPSKPTVTVSEDKETKQKMVAINIDKGTKVYYTTDKSTPTLYNNQAKNKIVLDKKGTYTFKFVSLKNGTRAYSSVKTVKIKVDENVYSQAFLKSLYIKGDSPLKKNTTAKFKLVSNSSKRKIKADIIRWSSSNTNVATVDKKGNVRGLKKGTVEIRAKVGTVKKKLTVKVK